MDKEEAAKLLSVELQEFRSKSYSELASLVEEQFELMNTHYRHIERDDGKWYQIRVNVYWDDKKKENLRVCGAIDDGGWRAFFPLTDGFIINSEGAFVGED